MSEKESKSYNELLSYFLYSRQEEFKQRLKERKSHQGNLWYTRGQKSPFNGNRFTEEASILEKIALEAGFALMAISMKSYAEGVLASMGGFPEGTIDADVCIFSASEEDGSLGKAINIIKQCKERKFVQKVKYIVCMSDAARKYLNLEHEPSANLDLRWQELAERYSTKDDSGTLDEICRVIKEKEERIKKLFEEISNSSENDSKTFIVMHPSDILIARNLDKKLRVFYFVPVPSEEG